MKKQTNLSSLGANRRSSLLSHAACLLFPSRVRVLALIIWSIERALGLRRPIKTCVCRVPCAVCRYRVRFIHIG
jgi:hypothetical protein